MTNIIYDVTNFAALKALTGTNLSGKKHVAYKASATDSLGGIFLWDGGDLSDEVLADTEGNNYVVPTALNANGSAGAFCRLTPQKPLEQWNLQDFPGADWDAKLLYALTNVDTGTGIIFPPNPASANAWLDFEDAYTIDTFLGEGGTGRAIQIIGHKTKVKYHGTGTWLTISASGANIGNARCSVQGLHIEPHTHYSGDALHISNTGNIVIQDCAVFRFANGAVIHNNNSWTENTKFINCDFRGNRNNIKGTATGTTYSQRGTQVISCVVGATYNPFGYTSDRTGDEAEVWHNGILLENVSWYHGIITANLQLKRSYSCGIKLDGGKLSSVHGFIEGEGTASTYDHVIGLWMKNHTSGQIPSAKGCDITWTLISIADGDEEVDADDPAAEDTGSAIIQDDRTGVKGNQALGNMRFRGTNFFTKYPAPSANVLYQTIPTSGVFDTTANYTIGLNGVLDSDGAIWKYESLTHDKDDGYGSWKEKYRVPEKELLSTVYPTEIPLWLKCTPYNDEIKGVDALTHGAGTILIDDASVNIGDTTVHMDGFTTNFAVGELFTVTHALETTIYQVTAVGRSTGTIRIDNAAGIAAGVSTAHMDGFYTFFAVGEIFTVAGDATLYTVTGVTNSSGDQADIAFTPVVATDWANNALVSIDATSNDADITFTPGAQTAWSNNDAVTIDATYNFIDLSETNSGVVRIGTAGTLYQVRGGKSGQRLAINNLNTSLVLKHYVDVNTAVEIDGDVTAGVKTAHLDGLTAVVQPGFTFKVEDDDTTYTVTACSALTVTDADIWFTPASTENWANNKDVTFFTADVFMMNNEADWTTTHSHAGKEFIYTYHSTVGWYWQEIGGSEYGGQTTVGYGHLLSTETGGSYDVTNAQFVRLNNSSTPVTVTDLTSPQNGQIVTISLGGSAAVTIDHNTSLIRLRGGEDLELNTYDTVTLQYQPTNQLWREISRNVERQNIIERQSSWTAGQMLDLHDTPRPLVSAPGSGYAVILEGVLLWYDYAAVFGVSGQSLEFRYTDGSGTLLASIAVTGFLDQTSDQFRWLYPVTTAGFAPVDNAEIVGYISGSDMTGTGSPLKFRALFRKVALGW